VFSSFWYVTCPPRLSLERLITPVVLNCQRNGGVLGGCLCKHAPFHVTTELFSTKAGVRPWEGCHRTSLEDPYAGKVIKQRLDTLLIKWLCTLQTWAIGPTVSDSLIVSATVFYVRFVSISGPRFELTCLGFSTSQLIKRGTRGGYASSHAVVSIVRLLVETNIATSKCLQVPDIFMHHACLTRVKATVSFATLLMVFLYPVRSFAS